MKVEDPQSLMEARASKRGSLGANGAAWTKTRRVTKVIEVGIFMVKEKSVAK